MNLSRRPLLISAILLASVLLNFASLGALWYSRKNPGFLGPSHPPRGAGFSALDKDLRLDEDQKKRFEALRQAHFAATGAILAEIHETRKTMVNELLLGQTNAARRSELTHRIGEAQSRLERHFIEHFAELRRVCNGDQRERLDAHLREMVASHGNRSHGGRGMPKGAPGPEDAPAPMRAP